MARPTDEAVAGLRELARVPSVPPPGVDDATWNKLTPRMKVVVRAFSGALREIREHQLDLLRLGTVDYFQGMAAELRKLRAETAAERNARQGAKGAP